MWNRHPDHNTVARTGIRWADRSLEREHPADGAIGPPPQFRHTPKRIRTGRSGIGTRGRAPCVWNWPGRPGLVRSSTATKPEHGSGSCGAARSEVIGWVDFACQAQRQGGESGGDSPGLLLSFPARQSGHGGSASFRLPQQPAPAAGQSPRAQESQRKTTAACVSATTQRTAQRRLGRRNIGYLDPANMIVDYSAGPVPPSTSPRYSGFGFGITAATCSLRAA